MRERRIGDTRWNFIVCEVKLPNGKNINADVFLEPVSDEIYFIVPDKCTECKGFHDDFSVLRFALLIVVFQIMIIKNLITWKTKVHASR